MGAVVLSFIVENALHVAQLTFLATTTIVRGNWYDSPWRLARWFVAAVTNTKRTMSCEWFAQLKLVVGQWGQSQWYPFVQSERNFEALGNRLLAIGYFS